MITRVFPKLGDALTVADAIQSLMALHPNDPYSNQKAAGSLGGASKSGFIVMNSAGLWVRVR